MESHPICILKTHIRGEMLNIYCSPTGYQLPRMGGKTKVPAVSTLGKEMWNVSKGEEQAA